MLRCLLTLILASALDACLQWCDLKEPTLSVTHSAVSPGENIQFNCTITYSRCQENVDVYLYQNKSYKISSKGSVSNVTFNLTVDASHPGQYSCNYSYSNDTERVNSSRSNTVEIILVNLHQPNIFFQDPHRRNDLGHQGSVLTRGHSFNITCSSKSQYPGSFYLFSGPNITKNQSAIDNTAFFIFPDADYSHQGNYSCVYEVNVSSCTFRSAPSDPLPIPVTAPSLSLKASLHPVISASVSAVLLLFAALLVTLLIKKKRNRNRKVHFSQVHQGAVNMHLNTLDEEDDEDDYVNVKQNDEEDYVNMNVVNIVELDVSSDESETDYVNMNIQNNYAQNR